MEKGEAGGILTSLLTSIKFGFCIPVARRQTTKRQFVLCLSCCAKSLSRMLSDSKMIGAMLCFLGSSFFGFGILWLLDRKLLTIGNVLFLSGLTLIFGPSQTLSFFNTRWKKVPFNILIMPSARVRTFSKTGILKAEVNRPPSS